MNLIDFILLAPLIYGLIRGLIKGLVHQLSGLLASVFGYLAAAKYADELSNNIQPFINFDQLWLLLFSYLLIFGAVAIAFYALSKLVTKALHFMALGFINRLLGALFGFCKMLLLLLIVLYLAIPLLGDGIEQSSRWKQSMIYPHLTDAAQKLGELWKNKPEIPKFQGIKLS